MIDIKSTLVGSQIGRHLSLPPLLHCFFPFPILLDQERRGQSEREGMEQRRQQWDRALLCAIFCRPLSFFPNLEMEGGQKLVNHQARKVSIRACQEILEQTLFFFIRADLCLVGTSYLKFKSHENSVQACHCKNVCVSSQMLAGASIILYLAPSKVATPPVLHTS